MDLSQGMCKFQVISSLSPLYARTCTHAAHVLGTLRSCSMSALRFGKYHRVVITLLLLMVWRRGGCQEAKEASVVDLALDAGDAVSTRTHTHTLALLGPPDL